MTDKPKPNPAASALARKRWAGTTKEQRREAMRAATAASPRTKKREPIDPPWHVTCDFVPDLVHEQHDGHQCVNPVNMYRLKPIGQPEDQ
jgi:hypothetical protein